MPWMVLVWMSGVFFLSLRLTLGWLYTRRLKFHGTHLLEEAWQEVLRRLCQRLRVPRPVRLLESVLVRTPTAIGWLRPVILLPVSALNGLTTRQLEAIIAHELAHIRRHDYLVNLVQAMIETLLFYHPAVWWVSSSIRRERENCCDDLAVAVCGDALGYVRALLEMEQLRATGPQLAMAANGGVLMNRIERLVGVQKQHTDRFAGLMAGVIVLTSVISVGVGAQILTADPGLPRAGVHSATPAGSATLERREPSAVIDARAAYNSVGSVDDAGGPAEEQDGVAEAISAMRSSNPDERAAAACSLGKLVAVNAIPLLIDMLSDETPIRDVKCWSDGNWSPARSVFKQASPGEQAAIALASLSQAAVEPLIGALGSENRATRRNAAWAIGEIRGGLGTNRSSAVGPLIAALSDDDPWVRAAAAFSLGEMRPRNAIGALIAALADSESMVREMVVRALGEMKTRAGVDSLTIVMLNDADERVRHKAAWALGEIRDPRALEALEIAANDQAQGVRATARWAISEIRD